MRNFKINKIFGEGYERWAYVTIDNFQEEICVHFLEYDEYLENTNRSSKREIVNIIQGNLRISLVTEFHYADELINGYWQKHNNSSNITAIGKVKEILGGDSVKCEIEGLGDDILVEFETDIKVEVDSFIKIEGSLELDLE